MTSPLPVVLVSQRVALDPKTGERRDALDQRWAPFLMACGFIAAAMPNDPTLIDSYLATFKPAAILLTGGNDLKVLGGDAPERDDTERALIEIALAQKIPLVGVCRGMQMIQHYFGVELEPVNGHVTPHQNIMFDGEPREVNSYHRFGTRTNVPELEICGAASDGVVKAMRARDHTVFGTMWHPERQKPFKDVDISLFRDVLRGQL